MEAGDGDITINGANNTFEGTVTAKTAGIPEANIIIGAGATNTTFEALVTANDYIDIGANTTFKAGATLETDGSIGIRPGATATFAGVITSNDPMDSGYLEIMSGGTLAVDSAVGVGGIILDNMNLDTEAGSTISFLDSGATGTVGRIDVAGGGEEIFLYTGTNLHIDDSVANVDNVVLFTDTAAGVISIDDKAPSGAETAKFLAGQSFNTFGSSNTFGFDDDGNIVYTTRNASNPWENAGGVMSGMGIHNDQHGILSDQTANSLFEFGKNGGQYGNAWMSSLSGPDLYFASLMKSATGASGYNAISNPDEAYALYQYLNGADMFGAIEATSDTARNLTLTPTIGLYYITSKTNTFDTTYRNGMKYKRDVVEMPIEVTAKYDIEVGCDSTLSLMANAGYAYNFNNKGTKVDRFVGGHSGALAGLGLGDYRGVDPGRSSWNAGAGVQYRYRNVDFGVNYDYYGRKNYNGHSLFANVGVSF